MTEITIVIPTRERCETLLHTIRTCLNQDVDGLKVVVSDNVSQDNTRAVVESFDDPRLRYIRPDIRLSMTSHFNFAISHVETGWVSSLGDDDALLPGAAQHAVDLIEEIGALPIAASSVYYGWPGLPDPALSNRLTFHNFSDNVAVCDSRAAIRDRITFKEFRDGYVWGLPGVYRGFVHTDLVRSVSQGGRYLNSITPDAYSAFTSAMLSPSYVRTSRPLFVEGVSPRSNGAAQALLADTAEEKRFLMESDIAIHADTVYSPAPAFVMIEAFLQARDTLPELAEGLEPDLRAMCLRAEMETLPAKIGPVREAIAEVLTRHQLAPATPLERKRASVRRRVQSVRKALVGATIDGDAYGIQNVYDASLVASTIWRYRCPESASHREGVGLLKDRLVQWARRD